MSSTQGTLHLVCGKIASGKSTLIADLGTGPDTIVLREDEWLSTLFGEEMISVADYVRYSARLRDILGPHVVALLNAGLSVGLDFPANTKEIRAWMRTLFEQAGAAHRLHYLDVADEVCKARLAERNAAGLHEFAVSDEQFERINRHFSAPSPDEGFEVIVHRP